MSITILSVFFNIKKTYLLLYYAQESLTIREVGKSRDEDGYDPDKITRYTYIDVYTRPKIF